MTQNILFTCAGRRNYLINYFKEAMRGQGKICAADLSATAPSLIDADIAIVMPNINDPNYIDALVSAIIKNDITAVISLNDLELPILAKNKSRIEATGAKLILSDERVIDITFDKWKTHLFIESIGLRSPKSYISIDEVHTALANGDLQFPLVLKPRWGSASIGIYFADRLEELDLTYKLQYLQLKKDNNNQNIDEAIIIQEKLLGVEYGMDVLNDFDGNFVNAFAREKLNMRSGETDKARSVIDTDLSHIGSSLGDSLRHIGNMDCDVFKCGTEYYVLELNPRFGGGYPFSHEAGVNTAAIYINWLNGVDDIEQFMRYEDGMLFSKCDRLIKVSSKK